jgi:oligopeptide transport system substrate-binding protein
MVIRRARERIPCPAVFFRPEREWVRLILNSEGHGMLTNSAFVGILTAALAAMAVGAPSAAHAAIQADPSKTFTLRIQGEPETLDWNKAHTPIETYLLMNLMEGLVGFDANLKPVPSLAQSWTLSPDGRTYTFKLRPGVKWSDGVALKAQHFVYSWKRLLSPVTAAPYAYFLFDVEGAEFYNKGAITDFNQVGVKALDDLTLQVKLARPVAYWIYVPTFWVTFPLREDVVDKHGAAWASPGRMASLGPYSLVAHDYDSKIVFKANPTYWGKRGNIESVVFQIVKDDSTALSLYESGKIDFLTDIASLDLKRLSSNPELRSFPYLKVGYLGFAVAKYPMNNPKIRRAIAMAIDKSKIADILHGRQQPATTFVPPKLMAYSPKVGLPFDPARAKAELRAAGIDASKPLNIELLTPNWEKTLTLAQFIQSELKKNLGIEVTLQPFDNKTFRAQLDLKIYPMFESSWGADYPDPDNFLTVFMSNAGNNRTGFKNAKFDEDVMTARGTMNAKAREKIYVELQKFLIEDQAAVVPLYYEPNLALVRKRVKNLELNPLNYLYLRKVELTP